MLSNASDLPLDDPAATIEHARLIRAKPLLRRFYQQSYKFFLDVSRGAPQGPRLEIGCGGGFLKDVVSEVFTSDVIMLPGIDVVAAAQSLPFANHSLAAIFMLNTLHHVPDVGSFFSEASRCLRPGGVIAMVEPANTPFSRFIYTYFHHEPFLPSASQWQLQRGGPLSTANGALPWIVFSRDRQRFHRLFPQLDLSSIECCSPLMYLLSGGFTLPSLLPGCVAPAIGFAERVLAPANRAIGLFMRVVLARR